MPSTVETTEIVCPKCGEEFADWRSMSLPSNPATMCPSCGYDISSDPLVHEEGIWAFDPPDDES